MRKRSNKRNQLNSCAWGARRWTSSLPMSTSAELHIMVQLQQVGPFLCQLATHGRTWVAKKSLTALNELGAYVMMCQNPSIVSAYFRFCHQMSIHTGQVVDIVMDMIRDNVCTASLATLLDNLYIASTCNGRFKNRFTEDRLNVHFALGDIEEKMSFRCNFDVVVEWYCELAKTNTHERIVRRATQYILNNYVRLPNGRVNLATVQRICRTYYSTFYPNHGVMGPIVNDIVVRMVKMVYTCTPSSTYGIDYRGMEWIQYIDMYTQRHLHFAQYVFNSIGFVPDSVVGIILHYTIEIHLPCERCIPSINALIHDAHTTQLTIHSVHSHEICVQCKNALTCTMKTTDVHVMCGLWGPNWEQIVYSTTSYNVVDMLLQTHIQSNSLDKMYKNFDLCDNVGAIEYTVPKVNACNDEWLGVFTQMINSHQLLTMTNPVFEPVRNTLQFLMYAREDELFDQLLKKMFNLAVLLEPILPKYAIGQVLEYLSSAPHIRNDSPYYGMENTISFIDPFYLEVMSESETTVMFMEAIIERYHSCNSSAEWDELCQNMNQMSRKRMGWSSW